jgi:hypothetical protein
LDPSFKGVVFSYLYQVLYVNNVNRNGSTYIVAKEVYVTNQLVLYFQRSFFMTEKFNEKITSYNEAGLTEKILSRYVDFAHLRTKVEDTKTPTKLSISQLTAVFQLYSAGMFLSIFAFAVEKIVEFVKVRKRRRKHEEKFVSRLMKK